MSRPDLTAMAVRERGELLALLRELTPAQWHAPSLCASWSVRDVATHVMSYDELSAVGLIGTFLRGGPSVTRVNQVALSRYRDLDTDGVIALAARNQQPRGLTAAMNGGIALTDGTIHHQDIRRALDLSRTIPSDRLAAVLDFSLGAPTLPSRKNHRRLRLVATDLDWTRGRKDSPEVRGPGEALLMALAGRTHALDDLSGDGLKMLRERMS